MSQGEHDKIDVKSRACWGMLAAWSGLHGGEIYSRPHNAQEILSVYALANGCSFEEAMEQAAWALLMEWRKENLEEFFPTKNVVAKAVEVIDKIVKEQRTA